MRKLIGAVALLLFALGVPAPARSQERGLDVAVSLFGGAALPLKTDITLSDPTGSFTFSDVELDSSATFGAKLSFWPGGKGARDLDVGIELDLTHFTPDISEQLVNSSLGPAILFSEDMSATILAVNALLRWPQGVTDEQPRGRWHPYLGVGLGGSRARVELVSGPSDTDVALAVQLLAGLKAFVSHNIALFGEYKFSYASHTFNLLGVDDERTIAANHFVAGLAVHF